jgi:phospholipase/lecithinase/hemolysin
MVVFGDSLADSGNNALLLGSTQSVPLSGADAPTYPYASNTYSNGQVWTQYLANSLGLSANPSIAGGTNYAFGGARTGNAVTGQTPGMLDQLGMYLGSTGGLASASTLYVLEGGGNDARDILGAVMLGLDPTLMIQSYAHNIAALLIQLHAAGAEEFLLWNVPNIGLSPLVIQLGGGAAASYYVSLMNQALNGVLGLLASDITDGLHLYDAYTGLSGIVGNPGGYGFTNVTDICAMDAACIANPTGYVFWDGLHPSTAAHAVMAQQALGVLPEPGSVMLIGLSLFALIMMRRRPA